MDLARAALLTGASTFVPIPFADEWVLVKARRDMMAALLRRADRSYAVDHVKPLYDEPSGSLLLLPFRLAGKLVLVPVRKALRAVFVVFAVRAAALQVGKTLALGAVVERLLARGLLRDEPSARAQAKAIRAAFEEAFAGSDVRALQDAAKKAVELVRRKPKATRESVAQALVGDAEPAPDAQGEVEHVLKEPQVQGFLDDLTRRVVEGLARRGVIVASVAAHGSASSR